MSTVCYDLSRSPPQFDALAFALYVNGMSRLGGLKRGAVKVLISPGPNDGFRACSTWPREAHIRRRLLDNVAIPIFRMMPAEVEVLDEPLNDRSVPLCGERGHGFDLLLDGYRSGGRSLRPLTVLPKNDRLITITLREADHWHERNSNLPEWLRVAEALPKDYSVVFIRDTVKADVPLGFDTDPRASTDLDYRCALYRSAYCNFGVNNGPTWVAFAVDAPMLIFKPTCVMKREPWAYSRAAFIEYGIKDQFPDCPPYQRIFWEDDNADAIIRGFREWRASAKA